MAVAALLVLKQEERAVDGRELAEPEVSASLKKLQYGTLSLNVDRLAPPPQPTVTWVVALNRPARRNDPYHLGLTGSLPGRRGTCARIRGCGRRPLYRTSARGLEARPGPSAPRTSPSLSRTSHPTSSREHGARGRRARAASIDELVLLRSRPPVLLRVRYAEPKHAIVRRVPETRGREDADPVVVGGVRMPELDDHPVAALALQHNTTQVHTEEDKVREGRGGKP